MFAVNNAGGEDQQDKKDYKDECTIFLLFLKQQCPQILLPWAMKVHMMHSS